MPIETLGQNDVYCKRIRKDFSCVNRSLGVERSNLKRRRTSFLTKLIRTGNQIWQLMEKHGGEKNG